MKDRRILMERLLEDKVALITGGSRGIGAATAKLFAEQGARVVVTARGEEALKRLCDGIADRGGEAAYFTGDAADLSAARGAVDFTLSRYGAVDILVCNAGMALRTPSLDMSVEEWERVMTVNLTAPMELAKLCLRHFKARGSGKLIFVASTAAKSVNMGASPSYGASKAGLVYLTRHYATEFARDNIQVNAVCPGPVDTEITKTWTPEHRAKVMASMPMGRIAAPDDIAKPILFLASHMADFITGESLMVNGGKFMD